MFLLLDSGAFSVRTQKKTVDLDEYCIFIREHIEHIDAYVSLDVMPVGADHGVPTKAATEASAAAGWENFLYMREAWGLDPIPVLHQGESFKWLDKMLEAGCTYIGLSPRIMNNSALKRQWLDTVWRRLVDDEGHPLVRTHGFGMNALPLLFAYPWHTVDASTWLKRAVFGKVLVPHFDQRTGTWDFSKIPKDIRVSAKAPVAADRLDKQSIIEQQYVVRWIEEAGRTLAECADSQYARCAVNAYFFKCVTEGDHGTKVFKPRAHALFGAA